MVIMWKLCEGGVRVRAGTIYVELLKRKRMDTRPRTGQRQAVEGLFLGGRWGGGRRKGGWQEEGQYRGAGVCKEVCGDKLGLVLAVLLAYAAAV
jgi:hypothetical protein